MTLPNFFVVGAQKSGTTSLYYYLNQHPEVYMSPVKEPHFFDYDEGRTFGGPAVPAPEIQGLGEYRELFGDVSGERAIGEATPTYLYLPGVPGRIERHVPEARFIAILRDPAERAYSAYQHAIRNGREPLSSFAEALAEEERRIRDGWHPIFHYRRRGFYHAQVSRYHETFGRERVRVYLYEDLRSDPLGLMRDAFRFLGVDDSFVPDMSTRYNITGVPRNRAVTSLVGSFKGFTPALKRVLPLEVRQRIKGRIFVKAPPLEEGVRRELVEDYREDVLRLQDLIGRDLSAWLETNRARERKT